jgi:hypothetical protein
MPFPRKFRYLLEPDPAMVPKPDYVWLAHAVCATDTSACGWAGWITEGIFRKTSERFPTSTGDQLLDAPEHDSCPRCGHPLFRTGIDVRCEPSVDQSRPEGKAGTDYEPGALEYE